LSKVVNNHQYWKHSERYLIKPFYGTLQIGANIIIMAFVSTFVGTIVIEDDSGDYTFIDPTGKSTLHCTVPDPTAAPAAVIVDDDDVDDDDVDDAELTAYYATTPTFSPEYWPASRSLTSPVCRNGCSAACVSPSCADGCSYTTLDDDDQRERTAYSPISSAPPTPTMSEVYGDTPEVSQPLDALPEEPLGDNEISQPVCDKTFAPVDDALPLVMPELRRAKRKRTSEVDEGFEPLAKRTRRATKGKILDGRSLRPRRQ
jgi:hypothetical protein